MRLDYWLAILSICPTVTVHGGMKPLIVGTDFARIHNFPHSAVLGVICKQSAKVEYYSCGSSIVNQAILLTAAHCFDGCIKGTSIEASVGSEYRERGTKHYARAYKKHENYVEDTNEYDIAVILLKTNINLKEQVRRVALVEKPPYKDKAFVAGWGTIDNEGTKKISSLKYAEQQVWDKQKCVKYLKSMPMGSFCAGPVNHNVAYPSFGDSGSALVVRNFIQIGLVSYKQAAFDSVVIYTDVGYFSSWIKTTARSLFCNGKV